MKGTWQTTEGSGGLLLPAACIGAGVLLAGSGAVAAVAGLLTSLVEVIGAIVLALVALVALVVVLAYRRGWRPSLDPVVAWTPLPEPEATPLESRAARALPAPQTVNNYNFYGVTPDQVAEVVRRQAITDRSQP